MPFVKIWIHAVWSTKNREHWLDKSFRHKLFDHIFKNALSKDILMEIVDGHSNHVHCLFRLKNDQSISKVMQLIKGESSFWLNQQKFNIEKFQWQEEYFAVSVSESKVNTTRAYIANQESHHRKKSFTQEYQQFIDKYNFQVFKDK
jgi:putative transposase